MTKTIPSPPPSIESPGLSGEDLVSQYYPAVYRLAYSILGDEGDAEDAAQECFIAALRSQDGFRRDASLKTWLFAIALNACRSALRKRKFRQALTQTWSSLQDLVGAQAGPEEQAERSESNRLLWAAVNRLDDRHRIPVILRYVHGCSVSEIASILEVQEGTVHSRLHYARHRLWEQLHVDDSCLLNDLEMRS